MTIDEMILIIIDKLGGKVTSKTKIHKLFYLYSVVHGKDISFKPHYYGPYSPVVEDALDRLISTGLLTVQKAKFENNHPGFETIKYDYIINKYGREVLNNLEIDDEVSELQQFVSKIKDIGDPDYFILSVATKIHYILKKIYYILNKKDEPLKVEDIIEMAKKLDGPISDSDIEKVLNLLENLKLINNIKHDSDFDSEMLDWDITAGDGIEPESW